MAWSDIFLPSSAQTPEEAQANLDRQTALFNSRLAAREAAGTISDERDADYQRFIGGVALDDQNAAAGAGFVEGLKESTGNLWSGVKDAVGGLSPAIWGVVVLVIVGLFIYAGGLGLIRGILKKS
jgi:hypothetical protein